LISFVGGVLGGIFAYLIMSLLFNKKEKKSISSRHVEEIPIRKEKAKEVKTPTEKKIEQDEIKSTTEKLPLDNVQIVEKKSLIESKQAKPAETKTEKQTAPATKTIQRSDDDGEWIVAKKGKSKPK